ncbi:MAG: single-stranded DNA-binding protein [Rothia sp. (in: high G+C Gram-positive bacteria)]|uniref:single-stranded DNA-binding protein n=1 Tax=Rothia sp. (in: high G+C Gram-positive bacteria) TaxID=1885016 RepID=UPI0026E09CC3|nr:single-stranded DNA-binding protein [Rothia sp. (in: high G+C Gram-positive bacteria)]MDO5750845.1 single-stranded DNA-binding protein [Rothia sp. (in: high G+C Gram-positive bacteria)]
MNDMVTIHGFVATAPTTRLMPSGAPVTNFRLGSTPRWFNSSTGSWQEGETNWYTVASFRRLAKNVQASVQVGQPLIVTGKIAIKNWTTKEGVPATAVNIEASSVGMDLNFGTSSFARSVGAAPVPDESYSADYTAQPAQNGQFQPAGHQQTATQHGRQMSYPWGQSGAGQSEHAGEDNTGPAPVAESQVGETPAQKSEGENLTQAKHTDTKQQGQASGASAFFAEGADDDTPPF